MRRLIVSILSLLLSAGWTIAQEIDQQSPQPGYSTATLREPLFDAARVEAEATAIDSWLRSNYRRLRPEQMPGPREQLYYLIDSRVKDLYAREGRILPKRHDPVLELLFSWAERLGVYGGYLAYNAVKSPAAEEMKPLRHPPEGITLGLRGDMVDIRSESAGWSMTVPYYFMILNVNDFIATGGPRTQLIAISTGAARDKGRLGYSQATLVFMFSPKGDGAAFGSYWKPRFGINDAAEQVALEVRGLTSQRVFETSSLLYKELTLWTEKQGPFAVLYTGLDGAYQWNRPHFLDFLRTLRIENVSPPN